MYLQRAIPVPIVESLNEVFEEKRTWIGPVFLFFFVFDILFLILGTLCDFLAVIYWTKLPRNAFNGYK